MKKTLIALLALGGLAAAYDYSYLEGVVYAPNYDYTLTITLNAVGGFSQSESTYLLKSDSNVHLFTQRGQYIGIEKDGNNDINGTNFYDQSPYSVTAGTTEGWFINFGGADRVNSLTFEFVGDAAANTTTISITKPNGDGAITSPIVLNVNTLIDPSKIQYNSTKISDLSVAYIPEPATATLSLLALAGLASRRRRH